MRKVSLILITLILIAFIVFACVPVGKGRIATSSRRTGAFTAVELELPAAVNISRGRRTGLKITAEENILKRIVVENRGGTLRIRTRRPRGTLLIPRRTIRITIKTRDLERIKISGSGSVTVAPLTTGNINLDIVGSGRMLFRKLTAERLKARITGSGYITFREGQARREEVSVSGSGYIMALGLVSESVRARVSGSGDITVRVSRRLYAEINGSGEIRYAGRPAIETNINGSGRLKEVKE